MMAHDTQKSRGKARKIQYVTIDVNEYEQVQP